MRRLGALPLEPGRGQRPQTRTIFAFTLIANFAWADTGAQIFAQRCALCHQADGQGAAGVAPSLHDTLKRFTTKPAGLHYLSQIAISGMAGTIDTENHKFSGLMPSFRDDLADADIAAVLTYVLSHFNAEPAAVIKPQDVAAARAANPTPTDTRHLRTQSLATP